MTTYYVDFVGNDSNNGSYSLPFQTIQKAANVMVAGDVCVVRGGNYSGRTIITTSGNLNVPIIYQACGVVNCSGFRIQASDIGIFGFTINSLIDTWNDSCGIYIGGSRVQVEGCNINYCLSRGIFMHHGAGQSGSVTGCIIRGNKLSRNATCGVSVAGTNHFIETNEVWDSIQYHPLKVPQTTSGDADGFRFFGSGHIFRNNYVHGIKFGIPENIDPHIDGFQTWNDSNYGVGINSQFDGNYVCLLGSLGLNGLGSRGFMLENSSGLEIYNNILEAHQVINAQNSPSLNIHHNILVSDYMGASRIPNGIELQNKTGCQVNNNIYLDTNLITSNWTPTNLRNAIKTLVGD